MAVISGKKCGNNVRVHPTKDHSNIIFLCLIRTQDYPKLSHYVVIMVIIVYSSCNHDVVNMHFV